ncbi:MAG: GntR family transcriptional regulator [Propionibacteriaceae bacterium]|nr:GntR family transcriptional regulator [Propionibacteriaceae bacterium]
MREAMVSVTGGDEVRPRTLSFESLLQLLRRDLANGVFHPRERLVEAELVEKYETTRGAVREALIQLTSEGLVERKPNRGASVRGMTWQEAVEVAQVRLCLEPMCAGLAAERGTEAERDQLVSFAASMVRAATEVVSGPSYLELNASFHSLIYTMSRHVTAASLLERFQLRPIDRYFPMPFRGPAPRNSLEDHSLIARRISEGDVLGAESAMRTHLEGLVHDLTVGRLSRVGVAMEGDRAGRRD